MHGWLALDGWINGWMVRGVMLGLLRPVSLLAGCLPETGKVAYISMRKQVSATISTLSVLVRVGVNLWPLLHPCRCRMYL